jgi:hypothetical protein
MANLNVSLSWQDVTIRLIAQRGVFHGKAPASFKRLMTMRGLFGRLRAGEKRRRSSASAASSTLGAHIARSSELYLEDETAYAKVLLPPPLGVRKYHLFCSVFNAGALQLAKELKESNVFVTWGKRASAPLSFTTDARKLSDCDHSSKAMHQTPANRRAPRRGSPLGWPVLILLDERTWTSGADTAQFVEHIHLAMRIGVRISCAHELPGVVGSPRHACDFALMVQPPTPRTRSVLYSSHWIV